MKILHAAETIKGGVATVINSLIQHQANQETISQIICLIPSDQVDNLVSVENLKIKQFQRNGRSILGMFKFLFAIFKVLLVEKPDVVHLHSSFAGLLGRIVIFLSGRRNKTKVIYCPHAFGFLMQTSRIKKIIYSYVELCLSKLTDKIICVSQSEYDAAVTAGFKKDKLTVIHNGVKLKDKINLHVKNYKKHYKLLFVGRFDYQKGIDIFAEAIVLLAQNKESGISYEFTLIGEAVNSNSEIKFQETENIKVNQLGWLKPNQLEEQYLSHDALVIPSRWEGFAMVPLEAMSYGLPIIGSDIDAFKEIKDSTAHITFFKLNSNALYNRLISLNKLDLELNSKKSLDVFKANYTETIMNENTLKLYK